MAKIPQDLQAKYNTFYSELKAGLDPSSIKKLYRQLVAKYHPDVNPGICQSFMQALNLAYEDALRGWDGRSYQSYNSQTKAHTEETYSYHDDYEKFVMTVIQWAVGMPGWEVELVGAWVWVTTPGKSDSNAVRYLQFKGDGETDTRKTFTGRNGNSIRFQWSKSQKRWYLDCREYKTAQAPKKRRASGWSYERVKDEYGATKYA